jgi:hypothetical protein
LIIFSFFYFQITIVDALLSPIIFKTNSLRATTSLNDLTLSRPIPVKSKTFVENSEDNPFESGAEQYNSTVVDAYFNKRPSFVLTRLLKLTSLTSNFVIKLALDWKLGKLEANEKERAKEVRTLRPFRT